MFARLGSTSAINEGISRSDFLKDFTVSLNFSIAVFTVASYSSAVLVMLGGGRWRWVGII